MSADDARAAGQVPHEHVAHEVLHVEAADGHRFELPARIPARPRRALLWLPALGVAARHYLPLADAFAATGTAVFVHEWRGNGSSSLRAGGGVDWGYRALLLDDIPASEAAVSAALPALPRVLGGHSLGGQLACCRLALSPGTAEGAWIVGSGSPYWRAFPWPYRPLLPLAYRFIAWLAAHNGVLPGRRIGFGGNEAAGLIRDWARTATSGRYAAAGIDAEQGLAHVRGRVRAVALAQDWMAPPSSLRFLLSKMPAADTATVVLDAASLGVPADHFAWMKSPAAVAAWLSR
jgi:predicted alpha/beta hydrolase